MGSNMGAPSEPVEGAGVEDENEQSPHAQRHISKIKHGKLLPVLGVSGMCHQTASGFDSDYGDGI